MCFDELDFNEIEEKEEKILMEYGKYLEDKYSLKTARFHYNNAYLYVIDFLCHIFLLESVYGQDLII